MWLYSIYYELLLHLCYMAIACINRFWCFANLKNFTQWIYVIVVSFMLTKGFYADNLCYSPHQLLYTLLICRDDILCVILIQNNVYLIYLHRTFTYSSSKTCTFLWLITWLVDLLITATDLPHFHPSAFSSRPSSSLPSSTRSRLVWCNTTEN